MLGFMLVVLLLACAGAPCAPGNNDAGSNSFLFDTDRGNLERSHLDQFTNWHNIIYNGRNLILWKLIQLFANIVINQTLNLPWSTP